MLDVAGARVVFIDDRHLASLVVDIFDEKKFFVPGIKDAVLVKCNRSRLIQTVHEHLVVFEHSIVIRIR